MIDFTDNQFIHNLCDHTKITKKEYLKICSYSVDDLYKIYKIKQKNKIRIIEEPIAVLKKIQKTFIPLFETFPLQTACMSKKGHNINDNAQVHVNSKYILKIDIKKCYQSITYPLVYSSIVSSTCKNKDLMIKILDLCFFSKKLSIKQRLPTGAPTSSILCNIALTPLDIIIQHIADEKGYKYTRYIDDLILSTANEKREWNLINTITNEIRKLGLHVNQKKTQWLTRGHSDSLIITGVSIGEGSSVPRKFRKAIRTKLDFFAKTQQTLNAEIIGSLAYIKSIDYSKYQDMLSYYDRRLKKWAE